MAVREPEPTVFVDAVSRKSARSAGSLLGRRLAARLSSAPSAASSSAGSNHCCRYVEDSADRIQPGCVVPAEPRKGKCMAESSGPRGPVKVVARYADGRVLKGTTLNFSPLARRSSSTRRVPASTASRSLSVPAIPKAIFFVRDLAGNAEYNDVQEFVLLSSGSDFAVMFKDGERLVGASLTYDAAREGFFPVSR